MYSNVPSLLVAFFPLGWWILTKSSFEISDVFLFLPLCLYGRLSLGWKSFNVNVSDLCCSFGTEMARESIICQHLNVSFSK